MLRSKSSFKLLTIAASLGNNLGNMLRKLKDILKTKSNYFIFSGAVNFFKIQTLFSYYNTILVSL